MTAALAADAFAINRDYERHCREARPIAATFFDAGTVATAILRQALS